MLSAREIETTLAELKPSLQQKYFIEKIGYFGSYASGTATDSSDVDILVEFRQPLGWEYFELLDVLEAKLSKKVDLVSTKALRPELKNIILQQVKYI